MMNYSKLIGTVILFSCLFSCGNDDDGTYVVKSENLRIKTVNLNGELIEEFIYDSNDNIKTRKKYKDNAFWYSVDYSKIGDTIILTETPKQYGIKKFVHLDENRVQRFSENQDNQYRIYYYNNDCGLTKIQNFLTQKKFGSTEDTTIITDFVSLSYFDDNCSFESDNHINYLDGKKHHLQATRIYTSPKERKGNITSQINKSDSKYNTTSTYEYNEHDFPTKEIRTQDGKSDVYIYTYY